MSRDPYTDWTKHFEDWENDPQSKGAWDSPSPTHWDRVANSLAEQEDDKRRPLGIWWWRFSGLAIVIIGVAFYAIVLPPSQVLSAFPVHTLNSNLSLDAVVTPNSLTEKTLTSSTTPPQITGTDQQSANYPASSAGRVITSAEPNIVQHSVPNSSLLLTKVLDHELHPTVTEAHLATEVLERKEPMGMTKTAAQALEPELISMTTSSTEAHSTALLATLSPRCLPQRIPVLPIQVSTTTSPILEVPTARWVVQAYTIHPADAGLETARLIWQMQEQNQWGLGFQFQRISATGWFAKLGLQKDRTDYNANTRYLRILTPNSETEEDGQLVSEYNIDDHILKSNSSANPTTVSIARSSTQALPQQVRIIFEVETAIVEHNLRIPLQVGRQFPLGPRWGVHLQAGIVPTYSSWERRTTDIQASLPQLRVQDVTIPDRVIRQTAWSTPLTLGSGLYWQPQSQWQVHLQWQRIATNEKAPLVIQQRQDQFQLGIGYTW